MRPEVKANKGGRSLLRADGVACEVVDNAASADLQAGETVVINGATGSFGSAAVAVALAMGAARVIATGRNSAALDALAARYGSRVRIAHK